MKRLLITSSLAAMLFGALPAHSEELFTGDTRLACEAILCLSTGKRPSECQPPLARYFGIHHRKLGDTLRARRDFLDMCPDEKGQMTDVKRAITNGAGRCDAAALNSQLMVWRGSDEPRVIQNTMPSYCTAYGNSSSVDPTNGVVTARYVGTPERGGYWVDAANYDAALAEYNARIAAEDAANQNQNRWGNRGS